MLKNSPILLAGGVAVALLLSGCHKDDAENTDAAPPPMPTRPAKPNAGVPGMGTKPTAGAPGTPGAGKGAQTAAGTSAAGKADPFAPKGAGKAGDKMQAKGKAGAGTGMPPAAGGVAGAPGIPGASPAGAPPGPGTPGAPAKPGTSAVAGTQVASVPKKRDYDPFKVTWKQVPPPPYVFGSVQPLRLASAEVEIPPVGEINMREVATRRVSGIMSGDGVFAILESADGDQPEIIKPGSMTKDGYRVVSITSDTVKLQRKDGNVIRTQIVPLTDASSTQQSSGLFGGRGGTSGGFPASGGFPGSGGGGPRSGGPTSGGRPGGGKRGGSSGAAGLD